ncbi:MAG: hypothetical protein OIN83_13110, partial [Candidatus Methanoperedens sp.]|nr:hypothetical protein [Candidatus Methanoperedens sp.]
DDTVKHIQNVLPYPVCISYFLIFQETISAYPMQGESIIAKGELSPLPCGRGLSSPFEPNEVKFFIDC